MIRKIFHSPTEGHSKEDSASGPKDPINTKRFPYHWAPGVSREKDGVIILSNEDPNEAKLNSLLEGVRAEGLTGDATASDDVNVEVTLRVPLGQSPLIMLLFTAKDALASTDESGPRSMSISFEVGLNGRVSVVETAGLLDEPTTEDNKGESQKDQGNEELELELRKKMSRVLETSQDIGILLEWVLRWRRQQHRG